MRKITMILFLFINCTSINQSNEEMVGDFAPIIIGNTWKYQCLHTLYSIDRIGYNDSYITIKIDSIRNENMSNIIFASVYDSTKCLYTNSVGDTLENNDSVYTGVMEFTEISDSIYLSKKVGFDTENMINPFYQKHVVSKNNCKVSILNNKKRIIYSEGKTQYIKDIGFYKEETDGFKPGWDNNKSMVLIEMNDEKI